MPSTLVHLALGGLVGAALLGEEFDARAVAVVLLAATIPDLDSFTVFVLPGSHRALLHNFVLPGAVAGALLYDTRWGERLRRTRRRLPRPGRLRARYGDRGVTLAWAGVASFVAGGLFPDLFTNGINAFYPLVDAFYTVDGRLLLSDQRGVVQTFVDLSPAEPAKTTEDVVYVTGVNPSPDGGAENVERVFPVAMAGWQLMLILVSTTVLAGRLLSERARSR
jgi:hypothetical protein